jgi:hypothetical protein
MGWMWTGEPPLSAVMPSRRPSPSWVRIEQRRISWRRPHPADQGPPLEDIEQLIFRAELAAESEWITLHGELPWDTGLMIFGPRDHQAVWWPRRYFQGERLFQLPPLGEVPELWLRLLR